MNKPDWKDAPEFAKWLAMDENGDWAWYEDKPWADEETESWVWPCPISGDWMLAGFCESTTESWRETLEARPSC